MKEKLKNIWPYAVSFFLLALLFSRIDFKDTWNTRDPIPQADCRLYRSDDLNARLLQAMPHCQHFDRPNWHGFEPDFHYEGCTYSFATFTVQRDKN